MTTESITRRDFLVRVAALWAALSAPGAWASALNGLSGPDGAGNFKAVYLDVAERDKFYLFLQNVFHLYPEDVLHQRILELSREKATDREIYAALLAELPRLKPFLAELRYDLPALRTQKNEMASQVMAFLGPDARANGFLEVGSFGRYHSELKHRMSLSGPVYIFNDPEPSYSPPDIMERGSLLKIGTFVPMGDYDPVPSSIPDRSLDLVINLIGFHHSPPAKLAPFVASLRRVLRPGGRMIVRDHDADTKKQDTLTALAHDVFNAGLLLSWEENARQVRLFRPLRDWSDYLTAAGFKRSERLLAQAHDPTQNLLGEYVKT
jgi:methyltransferase family protein